MNLVLQSFGRENEYRRAVLTVLSFYAFSSLPIGVTKVLLFTDKPDYFEKYFERIPITYILLTPEKIQSMRGTIDFLHRMKIAMIEEAFTMSEGPLFYADSDTFFIGDPTSYVEKVSPQQSFMHQLEYKLSKLCEWKLPAGKAFLDFLKLIEQKQFWLANGTPIKITVDHFSWNAGVMIFHSSHKQLIPDVYALTDQFYPPTHNHASEQYAFSIILQENTKLDSCYSCIYHYWPKVEKRIVDDFLLNYCSGWESLSFPKKLEVIRKHVAGLPAYIRKHNWRYRELSIQFFNDDNFSKGFLWAFLAFIKAPLSEPSFYRDVFYHAKRAFKLRR